MAELLPEGNYEAVATEVEFRTMTTGTQGVAVSFNITKGVHSGKAAYGSFWLTEGAIKKTVESLRFIGCRLQDGDITDTHGFGKKVRISVKHEEYEGKTRARVGFVNQMREEMADDDKKSIAAKFKGAVIDSFVADNALPPQATDDVNGASTSEEIPF
jgi:hypothetical protein